MKMSTISPGADESWLVFEQKAAFDEKKQAVYYYNTASGETTWQKPRESEAAAASDIDSEGVLGVFLPWACVQRGDMYLSEFVHASMRVHCWCALPACCCAQCCKCISNVGHVCDTCVRMRALTCFHKHVRTRIVSTGGMASTTADEDPLATVPDMNSWKSEGRLTASQDAAYAHAATTQRAEDKRA